MECFYSQEFSFYLKLMHFFMYVYVSKFKQGIVNKKKNPHVLRHGCNVIIGKLHKEIRKWTLSKSS